MSRVKLSLEELEYMKRSIEAKVWLNIDEAAFYLSMSKSTLYKMCSRGRIAYSKPEGTKFLWFKKVDLMAWLLEHRYQPCSQALDGPVAHLMPRSNA